MPPQVWSDRNAISVGRQKVAQVYKATWDEMKMLKFNWEDLGNLVVSKYFMFSPLYHRCGASSHQQNFSFRNWELRMLSWGKCHVQGKGIAVPFLRGMAQIWEHILSHSQLMRTWVSKSHCNQILWSDRVTTSLQNALHFFIFFLWWRDDKVTSLWFFFQGPGVETFVSETWRSPRGYLIRLPLLSLIFLCKCCGIKSSWQALISLLYAGMLQNQGGLWSLPRTTWPGKGKFCQNGRQGPMSEWHLPSGTYSG